MLEQSQDYAYRASYEGESMRSLHEERDGDQTDSDVVVRGNSLGIRLRRRALHGCKAAHQIRNWDCSVLRTDIGSALSVINAKRYS